MKIGFNYFYVPLYSPQALERVEGRLIRKLRRYRRRRQHGTPALLLRLESYA